MLHAGLLLATLTPGHVGGSETYVRGLLSAFAAGEGPERTTVLTHRTTAASLGIAQDGPVSWRELRGHAPAPGGARRAAWLVGALASARARPRRDLALNVVHAPLTVALPRIAGVPLVVTLHDAIHHEHPSSFGAAERAYRRLAYDQPAREAALVITVSEHARASIVARLGIDHERVVAIHHGIDHGRFRPAPADGDERRLAPLALPRRFVVYPANLWPHKNHEGLLEGLARTTTRDLAIVLTGQRSARWPGLLALARRLGIAARVHHAGYLPADTMPALYRRAAGLVFPSLVEGFGAPTLEAMACGCPVAAADAGAVAEITGDAALSFDARDPSAIGAALDRLADDESLRRRLTEAGPAHAAGFTWSTCARRHREAYDRARYAPRLRR